MVTMTARRDVSCRLVAAGKYMLTQPGKRPVAVEVIEDESTDLWVRSTPEGHTEPAMQRIEELAEDVCFHKLGNGLSGGIADIHDVQTLLQNAADLRQGLMVVERELCQLLGCQPGDASEMADGVMAAVRDGIGSAIELCALREVG